MTFSIEVVAMGQISLQVRRFSPLSITPLIPSLATSLCLIVAADNALKESD